MSALRASAEDYLVLNISSATSPIHPGHPPTTRLDSGWPWTSDVADAM